MSITVPRTSSATCVYRTPKSKCELSEVDAPWSLCYWRIAYTCSNFIARRLIGCKASWRSSMVTNDYQLYIISRRWSPRVPLALRGNVQLFVSTFPSRITVGIPQFPSRLRRSRQGISSRVEISESAVRYKFRRAVVIRSRRIHCCTPESWGDRGRLWARAGAPARAPHRCSV